jgi:hypothetical protein
MVNGLLCFTRRIVDTNTDVTLCAIRHVTARRGTTRTPNQLQNTTREASGNAKRRGTSTPANAKADHTKWEAETTGYVNWRNANGSCVARTVKTKREHYETRGLLGSNCSQGRCERRAKTTKRGVARRGDKARTTRRHVEPRMCSSAGTSSPATRRRAASSPHTTCVSV